MREQFLHSLLQNATDAFIVTDADGKIVEWAHQAEKLFGWTRDEAAGKALSALIISAHAAAAQGQDIYPCPDSGCRRIEVAALHKNKQELDIELIVTPAVADATVFFSVLIRDIAGRKKAERMLLESRSELQRALQAKSNIMDHSLDVICIIDRGGQFVQVGRACEKIWGYAPEELIGCSCLTLVHPEDRGLAIAANDAMAEGDSAFDFYNRCIRRDGNPVDMMWTCRWSEHDKLCYCVGRDMTESKKESLRLEESEQRFRSLLEHHPDALFSVDLDGRLLSANKVVSTLTGYSSESLAGMPFQQLVAPESAEEVSAHFFEAARGTPGNYETVCIRKDGSRFDVHVTSLPLVMDRRVVGVYGIARDITYSKNYERRIEYLANYDSLTGLPNRNLLDDRIRHAIIQADRLGLQIGILFLDLNRFKIINDSLGHDKGDLLLQSVANRLQENVREGDTVARLSGDEFVVVLENISAVEAVSVIAGNLLNAISMPINLDGVDLTVSTSMGASVYPKDGLDVATLLKNADLAMYQAKQLGSGMFRFYGCEMNTRVLERLLNENNLRLALERGELVLHYQPRIDVESREIVGMEALVRWVHPERGLVAPIDFIPLAEEIGVIGELGEWVLKTACRQNRLWQDQGLPPIKVSVNLSAHQLTPASTINQTIENVLIETGLDACWLELEITESSLMQNIESTLNMLLEIRDSGVSISVDDFGIGYSSLSYLKRLPINTLKIDKSFIRDIASDQDDAAIVTATIAMAHTMRLKVVAEGVTSDAQIRFLEAHRCDEVQGYLLSYPLPAEKLGRLLGYGRWNLPQGELKQ